MIPWLPREIISPVSDVEHEAVRIAQRALRLEPTGDMDEPTRASLRGLQRFYGLPVHGNLDALTAERVDALRPYVLGDA
jgi:putative peptidoglycan binding protein